MDPSAPPAPKQAGFLREGFRELGRKLNRRKLQNQIRKLATDRGQAAMRLGEQAWREKVGLEDQAPLKARLEGLDSRAGQLGATQTKLQEEKAALEARQKNETAKYDELRKGVDSRKSTADAALAKARQRLNEQTGSVAQLQTRLGSLASELAALEKPPAPNAAPDAGQLAQKETRKQEIAAEQKAVTDELAKANLNVPALTAEVTRLEGESRQLTAEIQKVESDRKTALAPIQTELNRVAGDTSAAQKEAGTVAEGRSAAFTRLGVAIYDSKSTEPSLAAAMSAIAAIDGHRASTQSALDASLLLTRTMASGTMLKFWSTVVLVPMLLVVLVAGSFFAWNWWHYRPSEATQTAQNADEGNAYLNHELNANAAYVLADKLAAAKSEEEVADLMMEAFKKIHLGVYTADGKQILAGSERSDKDFYLYDFEVRILAHAYFEHNVKSLDDESAALGATLLKLNHPEIFAPLLKQAMAVRYQAAVQQPDQPKSFLILLVDGLARHQPNPYSLEDVVDGPGDQIYLDPLQSFLITLDAFVPPPKAGGTVGQLFGSPWEEFGVVHAEGPCEIKGKEDEGEWGDMAEKMADWLDKEEKGTEAVGALGVVKGSAAELLEKGGKVLGYASDVLEPVHDLLWLYAVNIHIQPSSYTLHWNHGDAVNKATFTATVTYELKDPPKDPIHCGAAAGQKLPPSPQRLKGVQLMWNFIPFDCLQLTEQTSEQLKNLTGESNTGAAGSLSGTLGLQTTTGPDGTSQINMDISCHCPEPPWSGTRSRGYMVMASTRNVSSKMPSPVIGLTFDLPAIIANRLAGGVEYVMGGKSGYARFSMDHHLHDPYGGKQ